MSVQFTSINIFKVPIFGWTFNAKCYGLKNMKKINLTLEVLTVLHEQMLP